jgi:TonB family protein
MALTGQLSDMSLAELIEFFCNQRKTGRLKVDYHRGHGVFFIKDGELVDAKVGALSGVEAVYFALTLPNAAFDFSPEFQPTRRTIEDKWTQVVLEGLRRLDEGSSPTETDAFGGWTPTEAEMAMFKDHVDRLGENASQNKSKPAKSDAADTEQASAPLSMMVEGATDDGGGKRKWMVAGAVGCVVLAISVAAIPLSGRFSSKPASPAAATVAPQPDASSNPAASGDSAAAPEVASESPTSDAAPVEASAATNDEAASAAQREQREREQRWREQRDRERRLEEQSKKGDAATQSSAAPAAPAATGPKSVRVQVTYDESGRVTAASVAGSSPGAEAYSGTAVRVARGKRFPAGKAGSTVVTIPVN